MSTNALALAYIITSVAILAFLLYVNRAPKPTPRATFPTYWVNESTHERRCPLCPPARNNRDES